MALRTHLITLVPHVVLHVSRHEKYDIIADWIVMQGIGDTECGQIHYVILPNSDDILLSSLFIRRRFYIQI